MIRVAVCQVDVDHGRPFDERVEQVAALVREQSDCDLVVLPELWASGGFRFEHFTDEAQPVDGSFARAMSDAARTAGVWLHAGSFVERDADGHLFNTSLLFADDGELRATYRKIHLFGFREGESTVLDGGTDVVTCETPFGVVGLTTCYDLRFPELYRRLVDAGAVLALVPAAWPERRIAHWQVLTRARAIEDQLVVVAANVVGLQGEARLGGLSMVVDAWGDLLAEAGPDDAEVLHVDLEPADVDAVRERFPVLHDRRL